MSGIILFQLQESLKIQNVTAISESKALDYLKSMNRQISDQLFQQLLHNRDLQKVIASLVDENDLYANQTHNIASSSTTTTTTNTTANNNNNNNNNNNGSPNLNNTRGSLKKELVLPLKMPTSLPSDKRVYSPCKDERANIERLIHLLRKSPLILSSILKLGEDSLSSLPNEETLPDSILSVFGNCTTPKDELLFMKLIKTMIDRDFSEFKKKAAKYEATLANFTNKEFYSSKLLNAHLIRAYKAPYYSIFMDFIEGFVSERTFLFQDQKDNDNILYHISLLNLGRSTNKVDITSPKATTFVSPHLILSSSLLKSSTQLDWLDTGAREFISRVLDQVDRIPYSLRWLAKHTIELGRRSPLVPGQPPDHQPQQQPQEFTNDEKRAIFNTIFNNLLVPILVKADRFIGVDLPITVMQKFFAIANRIRSFMTDPLTIPDNLKPILLPKIEHFFNQVSLVQDLDDYFRAPSKIDNHDYKIPIFMTDIHKLFGTIESTKKHIAKVIDHNDGIKECIKLSDSLISVLDFSYGLIEVGVGLDEKPAIHQKKTLTSEEYLLRFAKNQLKQCLLMFSQLCGCSQTDSICSILLSQQNRNRDSNFPLIIQETIQTLYRLPNIYQENDFRLLLDEMFEDIEIEKEKSEKEKTTVTKSISSLHQQLDMVKYQTSILIESLVHHKLKVIARDEMFQNNKSILAGYASSVMEKKLCNCDPIKRFLQPKKRGQVDCEVCEVLPKIIANVLGRPGEELKETWPSLDSDCDGSGLKKALISMEKSILSQIYNDIFMVSQRDILFYSDLATLHNKLTPKSFGINENVYGNVLPFITAQEELKRINRFITPKDKIQVIKNTWSIITHTMNALGLEIAPDEYMSIMSFVIFKANVPQLLSNIQFIKLYSNPSIIDEIDSQEFEKFLGVVCYVDEVTSKRPIAA